jgi:alpha-mannosidase
MYVLGKDAAKARGLSNVKVRLKENGNLVASLLVEGEAPGCKSYTAEYRIIDGIARVDIIDQLDKRAVRQKEAVHIAFPFNVADGQLRYDVAYGVVRPELDQLKGSCKNFFSTQSWVDISNGDRGITWASPDAPLIEIGSITAEQPWARTTQSSGLVYSYLMNNYWHTNYKADQEGKAAFRFSILPHAGFRPEGAARFGRETRQPMLGLIANTAIPVPPPLFHLQPPEIMVFSLEPLAGGGGWLVGLYNPTGTDREAVLDWGQTPQPAMYLSDDAGHAGPRVAGSLKLVPWGSAFVRVDR